MMIEFAVYDPPKKGMPFLAVRIDGVKTKSKKVLAVAAKTREQAEVLVEEHRKDLTDPHWRERARLHNAYGASKPRGANRS
jgi:hypothetical protein